jgi:hypothetical protein
MIACQTTSLAEISIGAGILVECCPHGSSVTPTGLPVYGAFRSRCAAEDGRTRAAEPCCRAADAWAVHPQAPRPAPPAPPGSSSPPQVLPHTARPDRRLALLSYLPRCGAKQGRGPWILDQTWIVLLTHVAVFEKSIPQICGSGCFCMVITVPAIPGSRLCF